MALHFLSKRALSTVGHTPTIEKALFGTTQCGKNVDLFRMSNASGMTIEVINYGAHLRTVRVPDRNNQPTDVTIGLANMDDYEQRNDYFGCIVGRYANRIRHGQFKLNKQEYQLGINDGLNTLHGGFDGFNKQMWTVTSEIHDSDKMGIQLNYVSPDGEGGYPSMCDVTCQYLLHLHENTFEITYRATTDGQTILNLTQHAYWNLSGVFDEENAICNGSHELQIHSSFITPIDEQLIPTGDLYHVNDTPFDFKRLFDIGSRINQSTNCEQLAFGKGYDHNWVINNDGYKTGDLMTDVAVLKSNESGISLSISTTEPGIQFYSGNMLDGSKKDKQGRAIERRSACCLETQHFPDSPNKVNFPSTVLSANKGAFASRTIHQFSC
eukprot:255232_1